MKWIGKVSRIIRSISVIFAVILALKKALETFVEEIEKLNIELNPKNDGEK